MEGAGFSEILFHRPGPKISAAAEAIQCKNYIKTSFSPIATRPTLCCVLVYVSLSAHRNSAVRSDGTFTEMLVIFEACQHCCYYTRRIYFVYNI